VATPHVCLCFIWWSASESDRNVLFLYVGAKIIQNGWRGVGTSSSAVTKGTNPCEELEFNFPSNDFISRHFCFPCTFSLTVSSFYYRPRPFFCSLS